MLESADFISAGCLYWSLLFGAVVAFINFSRHVYIGYLAFPSRLQNGNFCMSPSLFANFN